MMDFGFGLVIGFTVALVLGWGAMLVDEIKCAKQHNVYSCEFHTEWRPVQSNN